MRDGEGEERRGRRSEGRTIGGIYKIRKQVKRDGQLKKLRRGVCGGGCSLYLFFK